MEKSESIKNVMAALGLFQAKAVKIRKDAKNPWFKSKYATLANILDEIQPILTESKLVFTQIPEESTHLITYLFHSDTGEFISSRYELKCCLTIPVDDNKQKMWDRGYISPQDLGSAITYARRYALTSILGLNIDDDDDGNAASGKKADPAPAQNNNQQQQQQNNSRPQQNGQQQPSTAPLTPFNNKYTDAKAIIAVIKTAAKLEELNLLYLSNTEFIEKNQEVKTELSNKKVLIKNQGKVIITDNQFQQVCDRIRKGDVTVYENAVKVYILNQGQIEQLQHLEKERFQFEEALKIKYQNPADIITMINNCRTPEHVLALHRNNALIIDRDAELTTKINGKLRALKTPAQ